MRDLIPLQWLLDRAARELERIPPPVAVKFRFADGSAETLPPARWIKPTARQAVLMQLISAIDNEEIALLCPFGTKVRSNPDPLAAIERSAVSREDAGKILGLCGIAPAALDEMPRATPAEIVLRERKAGKTEPEIVAVIDREWSGPARLTHRAIGALFPNAEHETGAALDKRGKRLRAKT